MTRRKVEREKPLVEIGGSMGGVRKPPGCDLHRARLRMFGLDRKNVLKSLANLRDDVLVGSGDG